MNRIRIARAIRALYIGNLVLATVVVVGWTLTLVPWWISGVVLALTGLAAAGIWASCVLDEAQS